MTPKFVLLTTMQFCPPESKSVGERLRVCIFASSPDNSNSFQNKETAAAYETFPKMLATSKTAGGAC